MDLSSARPQLASLVHFLPFTFLGDVISRGRKGLVAFLCSNGSAHSPNKVLTQTFHNHKWRCQCIAGWWRRREGIWTQSLWIRKERTCSAMNHLAQIVTSNCRQQLLLLRRKAAFSHTITVWESSDALQSSSHYCMKIVIVEWLTSFLTQRPTKPRCSCSPVSADSSQQTFGFFGFTHLCQCIILLRLVCCIYSEILIEHCRWLQ